MTLVDQHSTILDHHGGGRKDHPGKQYTREKITAPSGDTKNKIFTIVTPKQQISTCGKFHLSRLNGDSSWLIECPDSNEELQQNHPHEYAEAGRNKSSALNKTRRKSKEPCRIILDPWLEPSPGIDGCACFSTTFPTSPAVDINDLLLNFPPSIADEDDNTMTTARRTSINAIVISLPFSDHCHEDTLDVFPNTIPIIAANGSFARLKAHYGKSRTIINLPSSNCDIQNAVCIPRSSVTISTVQSKLGVLDPTHRGILINSNLHRRDILENDIIGTSSRNENGREEENQSYVIESKSNSGLLYAPHGLRLSHVQKVKLSSLVPCGLCLLSTVSLYDLPLFLGGTVNLGMDNAQELIRDLKNVKDFIPTHSSMNRHQSGLVTKFAKVLTVDIESEVFMNKIGKDVVRVAEKPM